MASEELLAAERLALEVLQNIRAAISRQDAEEFQNLVSPNVDIGVAAKRLNRDKRTVTRWAERDGQLKKFEGKNQVPLAWIEEKLAGKAAR